MRQLNTNLLKTITNKETQKAKKLQQSEPQHKQPEENKT